jgi:voltage-gated potassium channel
MKRYLPLLVALFGFLILQPIAVTLSGANVPLNVLLYVLFLTAIYAVGPQKTLVIVATGLVFVIVATRLLYETSPNVNLLRLTHGLSFALMVLVTVTMISRVLVAHEITGEIVIGPVCIYLIIGAAWTFLYFVLQAAAPGSMMVIPIADHGSLIPQLEQYRFWEMLYFSMGALSTMGFLSTEALTPLARQLAVVEAIMGQMYVAVLIARIVALSTASAMKSGQTDERVESRP